MHKFIICLLNSYEGEHTDVLICHRGCFMIFTQSLMNRKTCENDDYAIIISMSTSIQS